MSDKEEISTKATPQASRPGSRAMSPTPSAATLAVPTALPSEAPPPTVEKPITRSSSPSGLPIELECKSRTQLGRVETLKTMIDHLPETVMETSLDEVKAYMEQVDEVHKAFQKEHSYLEVTWPKGHFTHDYFVDKWYEHEMCAVFELRRRLNKLKAALNKEATMAATTSSNATATRRPTKLPELTLPTFPGHYEAWPAFSDLFESIIINNAEISQVEKLHYLRSCLRGDTIKVIFQLPSKGDSFPIAWAKMKHRFENKRVIIQSLLDKIFTAPPMHERTAVALHNVASSLRDLNDSLRALATSEELWNCALVHRASRNLDKATQEAWETSRGTSAEFPKPEQLER
ncbi:uncharacterized protein LOC114882483 [Osmia bicornis bicornis]|uniref:uncharacterized protein LOC114882483 n=1 Tax=Osmia bicornis bicornis TaxID=1437191 RepID=UPI0010F8DED8|nr:uncharacterized protein LOC114882483 [Osmia bicornis bicornis]